MTNDRRVSQEALDIALGESRNSFGVEARERAPKRLALPQDREPREPRLESFEAEFLVQAYVVDDRPAPFVVVVRDVLRCARTPRTPRSPVGADHDVLH